MDPLLQAFLTVAPVLVIGLIGYGELKSKVNENRAARAAMAISFEVLRDRVASSEAKIAVTQEQFRQIMHKLNEIEIDLKELRKK